MCVCVCRIGGIVGVKGAGWWVGGWVGARTPVIRAGKGGWEGGVGSGEGGRGKEERGVNGWREGEGEGEGGGEGGGGRSGGRGGEGGQAGRGEEGVGGRLPLDSDMLPTRICCRLGYVTDSDVADSDMSPTRICHQLGCRRLGYVTDSDMLPARIAPGEGGIGGRWRDARGRAAVTESDRSPTRIGHRLG